MSKGVNNDGGNGSALLPEEEGRPGLPKGGPGLAKRSGSASEGDPGLLESNGPALGELPGTLHVDMLRRFFSPSDMAKSSLP
jgi:hypothetical protein